MNAAVRHSFWLRWLRMAYENTMRTLLVGYVFAHTIISAGTRYSDICYQKQYGWHIKHSENKTKTQLNPSALRPQRAKPQTKQLVMYTYNSAEVIYTIIYCLIVSMVMMEPLSASMPTYTSVHLFSRNTIKQAGEPHAHRPRPDW